uniref:Uncharacterized protein n=1 Tax=Craspedostauros australis TaxID=1486917 RepID=A0A7R9WP55_9STRA|mmetsp:Transcript_11899/g.32739  ORF Transcript_11899/g.32739 Transcript_11899/m.32739 type:complete len:161 (+) Transcript_11899:240-722(+)
MIEVPLSIVAWFSVVAVQAIVHFVVLGSRRQRKQHQHEDLNEAALFLDDMQIRDKREFRQDSSYDLDEADAASSGLSDAYRGIASSCPDLSFAGMEDFSIRSGSSAHQRSSTCSCSDIVDELDGDEPQNFLELLDQTGEEMVQNLSVENIAKEQIGSIEQ